MTWVPALWHHTSGGNELLSTAVTTEGGGLSSVSVSDSLETLTKGQEAELKMLRVSRMGRIRNEYVKRTAQAGQAGDKVRLRWF